MTKEKFVLPFTVEHKYGKIRIVAGAAVDTKAFVVDAITNGFGGKPGSKKTSKAPMSKSARAALSKRMKATWAAKRKAKNAAS